MIHGDFLEFTLICIKICTASFAKAQVSEVSQTQSFCTVYRACLNDRYEIRTFREILNLSLQCYTRKTYLVLAMQTTLCISKFTAVLVNASNPQCLLLHK